MNDPEAKSTRREVLGTAAAILGGAVTLGASGCSSDSPSADDDNNSRNGERDAAMPNVPLHYDTLSGIASRIAEGELSSVEVTEQMLARIAALEPRLHSYYTVTADLALEQAAAVDAQRERGEGLGPLAGVPIALKDLCRVRGVVTTGGHSFRKNQVADYDSTVAARLAAAGAVLLGKLATTEGAMVGYHPDFEVPRNPWGPDLWPGVSSGGSGVATAAGLCFGSLGTDTGGSIRYPSAANGIVGLKPTWGRVSRYGVLDLAPTLDHVGPMTRSVRDAARILRVIAGPDENDPTSLPESVPDYESEMERGVAGLRIGFDEAYATDGVLPHIASAVRDAVNRLAGLGAEIVEIRVPKIDVEDFPDWSVIASTEALQVHAATFPALVEQYGDGFRGFLENVSAIDEPTLARATDARQKLIETLEPVFDDIDLLVSPTLAIDVFRYQPERTYQGIDTEAGTISGAPLDWFGKSDHFVKFWDYNGYPTLSLPCGFSPDKIPLSLQLVGAPLGEAKLCRAGHAYEQDTEWHLEHPQV